MDPFDYDYIDNYLMGKFSHSELSLFEERLKTDKLFADAVSERKVAVDLIVKASEIELKKETKDVYQKYKANGKSNSNLRKLLPLLAVACGFLLLLTFYLLSKGSEDNQLFDQYYQAYNTSIGERAVGDDLKMKLGEANQYYQQKEYRNALTIFESFSPDILDSKIQLMMGLCHLELGQTVKANTHFLQLYSDKDPVFQYHGLWYSALTYLKAEKVDLCKIQLQKLIEANAPIEIFKLAEAKQLLKKL